MAHVFISYRRADSEGYVGRLHDQLLRFFEQAQIFMDVDGILPGADFVAAIENRIAQSSALLAVIGPQWLTICDQHGRRRLDQPNDFVRLEIAAALRRNLLVIPVLVGRAVMPAAHELPADLAGLARRNAVELSHERFAYDVERIAHAIGGIHSTLVVQLQFKPVGTVFLVDGQHALLSFSRETNSKTILVQMGADETKAKPYTEPVKLQIGTGEHLLRATYRRQVEWTPQFIMSKKSLKDMFPFFESNVLTVTTKVGQEQPLSLDWEQTVPAQYQIVQGPDYGIRNFRNEQKEMVAPAQYRLVLKPY